MAKIYGDVTGEILAIRLNPEEEAIYPVQNPASVLEFDVITNTNILPVINTDHNNHKLLDGVLTYKGVPYTIQPDSEAEQDHKALNNRIQLLRDYLSLPSPTNVQTVTVVKIIIRILIRLVLK